MSGSDRVLEAARERAAALVDRDVERLTRLIHADFSWTSHRGDRFGREAYLERNCRGAIRWLGQQLRDPEVVLVSDTAVLTAVVEDEIDLGEGPLRFAMPMTQTWVHVQGQWQLLAGHAGPRL